MTIWTRYGAGDIASGETYIVVRPKNYTAPKRAILYVHGVESSDGSIAWQSYAERRALFNGLAEAGHVILSCTHGGNSTWGNATVLARLTAAKNFLLGLPGVLPTKVALVGTSMGGLSSLNWAAANPSMVSCMVGIIPVVNLTDVHTNNRGGFTSAINAAYGGTYSEGSLGAAHNPNTIAAAGGFSSLPIQLWYGDSDAIVAPSTVTGFKANAGASCQAISMTGSHSEAIVSQVSLSSVLSFIAAAG